MKAAEAALIEPNGYLPAGHVYLIQGATPGAHACLPAPTGKQGTLHHMGLPAQNDSSLTPAFGVLGANRSRQVMPDSRVLSGARFVA
jgi:hypothetical protein